MFNCLYHAGLILLDAPTATHVVSGQTLYSLEIKFITFFLHNFF